MRGRLECNKPPIELAHVMRRRAAGQMGAAGRIRAAGGRVYLTGEGWGGPWCRRVVCTRRLEGEELEL